MSTTKQTRRRLLITAGVAVVALIFVINFAVNRWEKMNNQFSCAAPSQPWSWQNAKANETVTSSTFTDNGLDIQTIVLAASPRTKGTPTKVAAPKISVTCGPVGQAKDGADLEWTVSVDWMMGFSIAGMKDVGKYDTVLFGDLSCNTRLDDNLLKTQLLKGDAADAWLNDVLEHDTVLADVKFNDGPNHHYRFDLSGLRSALEKIEGCSL